MSRALPGQVRDPSAFGVESATSTLSAWVHRLCPPNSTVTELPSLPTPPGPRQSRVSAGQQACDGLAGVSGVMP